MKKRWSDFPPPAVDITDEERRMLSPLDDEALGRYFTLLAEATPEDRERIQTEFLQALREGRDPRLP